VTSTPPKDRLVHEERKLDRLEEDRLLAVTLMCEKGVV
jgi:hypothetical protein